ncbi:GTPase HflX OS=Streptomyces microflavus OX=1919 GN=hflX PE=3 SV=1 [Streptomyces microflavus]
MLVGVWTSGTVRDAEISLAELAALAETAGAQVLDAVYQRRASPTRRLHRVRQALQLRDIVLESGADTVVCDGELSPGQLIHLEDVVKVKVVDRTALILDIFAQHAKSRDGRKAQISLARCSTCCRGCAAGVSRSPSRIGSRRFRRRWRHRHASAPGATKIETDRAADPRKMGERCAGRPRR